ncbi:MAG: hypothetical protein ABUJ92_00655 [Desulfobacterales bacterium]
MSNKKETDETRYFYACRALIINHYGEDMKSWPSDIFDRYDSALVEAIKSGMEER